MPDGQHQTALGQCRYVDHKKNIFGTSTSTSTTVSCSRKVPLLAYVALVLCESPRLNKGAPFVNQCSSNHLPQRWVRARAEHVSCGSWGWSNGKQSSMLSQDGKVWETKDRARTKVDVRKVPGWGLPFPGWRRKRGRRSPKTAA